MGAPPEGRTDPTAGLMEDNTSSSASSSSSGSPPTTVDTTYEDSGGEQIEDARGPASFASVDPRNGWAGGHWSAGKLKALLRVMGMGELRARAIAQAVAEQKLSIPEVQQLIQAEVPGTVGDIAGQLFESVATGGAKSPEVFQSVMEGDWDAAWSGAGQQWQRIWAGNNPDKKLDQLNDDFAGIGGDVLQEAFKENTNAPGNTDPTTGLMEDNTTRVDPTTSSGSRPRTGELDHEAGWFENFSTGKITPTKEGLAAIRSSREGTYWDKKGIDRKHLNFEEALKAARRMWEPNGDPVQQLTQDGVLTAVLDSMTGNSAAGERPQIPKNFALTEGAAMQLTANFADGSLEPNGAVMDLRFLGVDTGDITGGLTGLDDGRLRRDASAFGRGVADPTDVKARLGWPNDPQAQQNEFALDGMDGDASIGLGSTAFDPTPEEMGHAGVESPKFSPRELKNKLLGLKGDELENFQRDMWEAGFYGDAAVLQGNTPVFRYMGEQTVAAIDKLINDIVTNPGQIHDLGDFMTHRRAETVNLHEDARNTRQNYPEGVFTSFSKFRDSQIKGEVGNLLRSVLMQDAPDELIREITERVNADVVNYAGDQHQSRIKAQQEIFDAKVGAGLIEDGFIDNRGYSTERRESLVQGRDPAQNTTTFQQQMGPISSNEFSEGGVDWALAAIKEQESGGSYTARNPGSSAGGAYQFINGTWLGLGGPDMSDHPNFNGSHAQVAKAEDQDRIARKSITAKYKEYGDWFKAIGSWIYPVHVRNGTMDAPIPDHFMADGSPMTTAKYASMAMEKAFGPDSGLSPVNKPAYDGFALGDLSAIGVTPNTRRPGEFMDAEGNVTDVSIPYVNKNASGQTITHSPGATSRVPGQNPGNKLVEIPAQMDQSELGVIAQDTALQKYEPEIKSRRMIQYINILKGAGNGQY